MGARRINVPYNGIPFLRGYDGIPHIDIPMPCHRLTVYTYSLGIVVVPLFARGKRTCALYWWRVELPKRASPERS